jgi:hypothetical protein
MKGRGIPQRQLDDEEEAVHRQQRRQYGGRGAQPHQPLRLGDDADGTEHDLAIGASQPSSSPLFSQLLDRPISSAVTKYTHVCATSHSIAWFSAT